MSKQSELDEILNEVRYASWSMGIQSSSQEELHSSNNNRRGTSEAKQAILDWHTRKLNDAMWDLRQFLLEEGRQDLLMKYDKLKEAEL